MYKAAFGRYVYELATIFVCTFILNLIWENLHAPLYSNYQGGPITELILLRATLWDAAALTILAFPFVVFPHWRTWLWITSIFSTAIAILREMHELPLGTWAYTSSMPLIPYFDVGLSPVLQLPVTSFAVYALVLLRKEH